MKNRLKAIHVLWTLPIPKTKKKILSEYETQTLILSAKAIKKTNSITTILYTDLRGLKFIQKNNLNNLWDQINVKDLNLFNLEFKHKASDFVIAGKVHVMSLQKKPFIMLDLDAILYQKIPSHYFKNDICYAHQEKNAEKFYLNPNKKNWPFLKSEFKDLNWSLPWTMNVSLLYVKPGPWFEAFIRNTNIFLDKLKCSLVPSSERVSYYTTLEQRLLTLTVVKSKIKYDNFLSIHYDMNKIVPVRQRKQKTKKRISNYIHLWFFKKHLNQSPYLQSSYMKNIYKKVSTCFSLEEFENLKKIPQIKKISSR